MAMGAVKGQESSLQVAIVCLDELVPEDCRYRRLDRLVDWSFVREAASPYCADDVGRRSVDPIVLVKLMVAAALEGIGSTRGLCRVASLRLGLRRLLGYGFHERLPVDQTLSLAQTRRSPPPGRSWPELRPFWPLSPRGAASAPLVETPTFSALLSMGHMTHLS
jgi:hypothetical protein